MKTKLLPSAVATALVFAIGIVAAQAQDHQGANAPVAGQTGRPSESSAAPASSETGGARGTTGREQRGPGGFSPQESSPANGGINLPSAQTRASPATTPNLSNEQRTKIIAIFRDRKAAPAKLNIPVHIGARVPDDVNLNPLPENVVRVFPDWRGYNYVLVANEFLIIDPATHEIVAILVA